MTIRSHYPVDHEGQGLEIRVRQRVEIVITDPPQARYLDRRCRDVQVRDSFEQFRAAAARGDLAGGALVMCCFETFKK